MRPRELQKAFGAVLRDARKKLDFSQEQLALEAGVDRTFVSMLERGVRQPTLVTVFKLAPVLGLSPAVLMARTADRLKS